MPQNRSKLMSTRNLIRVGEEMLKNGANAAQALKTIFPDKARTAKQTYALAHRIRQHPIVAEMLHREGAVTGAAISEALDRYGVTADNAAHALARLAFTDYDQIMDWATVTDPDTGERRMVVSVKASADIDPAARTAISEVTQRPDGSISIKLADKRAAIMDLARLKGWVQDKPEQPIAAVQLIIQR